MQKAARGLSVAAVVLAVVSLFAEILHMIFAVSTRWLATGALIYAVGLLPVALVLCITVRKEQRFRWSGLICALICAGLLHISDTVSEILFKNRAEPILENPVIVDMLMLGSLLVTIVSAAFTITAAIIDALYSLRQSQQNKDPINLSTKIFWEDMVHGLLWIVTGVSGMFHNIRILEFIHYTSLWGALGLSWVMLNIKSDRFDEMALANYQAAKAKTLDILCLILGGICLIALIFVPNFEMISKWSLFLNSCSKLALDDIWVGIAFCIVGLTSIIKGLIFRKLEAA